MCIWMLALAPFALIGCADETPPPVTTTTTTTTTQEVTTGVPTSGVVTREVVVPQAPPTVRIEAQTVAPGPGYISTPGCWRWSGRDYVWVSGSWVRLPVQQLFGSRDIGRAEAQVRFGFQVTEDKPDVVCKSDLHRAVLSTFLRRDA
jgi:hypothetical protein